jgi:hypothetical protein
VKLTRIEGSAQLVFSLERHEAAGGGVKAAKVECGEPGQSKRAEPKRAKLEDPEQMVCWLKRNAEHNTTKTEKREASQKLCDSEPLPKQRRLDKGRIQAVQRQKALAWICQVWPSVRIPELPPMPRRNIQLPLLAPPETCAPISLLPPFPGLGIILPQLAPPKRAPASDCVCPTLPPFPDVDIELPVLAPPEDALFPDIELPPEDAHRPDNELPPLVPPVERYSCRLAVTHRAKWKANVLRASAESAGRSDM